METIRAQLAPRLEGRTLARVEILDPRLTRPYDLFEVVEELEGDRVVAVERRGKYLLLRLESGLALLVHLRMTGSFGFVPTSHERAVIELDDGTRLATATSAASEPGSCSKDAELEPYLATKNGPEPLGPRFTSALARRAARPPARAAQSRAPRPARRRGPREHLRRRGALARAAEPAEARKRGRAAEDADACVRAIRAALGMGIERQGSTLTDYVTPGGLGGRDAGRVPRLRPRGRAVPPLPHADREDAGGGRGTWYCPRCQLPISDVCYEPDVRPSLVSPSARSAGGRRRSTPHELRELAPRSSWRSRARLGEGLLVCPDCDAEDREREFEEGEGG